MPISARIVERAASMCWRYGLCAYDALPLSSALTWKEVTGDEEIFDCFDKSLLEATRQEGLQVWPE